MAEQEIAATRKSNRNRNRMTTTNAAPRSRELRIEKQRVTDIVHSYVDELGRLEEVPSGAQRFPSRL